VGRGIRRGRGGGEREGGREGGEREEGERRRERGGGREYLLYGVDHGWNERKRA
jgi:hypothetical protein